MLLLGFLKTILLQEIVTFSKSLEINPVQTAEIASFTVYSEQILVQMALCYSNFV